MTPRNVKQRVQRTVNLRPPLSPFMSRREVADYLRVHPNSVDRLARAGLLARYRIEGLDVLLYRRSEVEGVVVEDDPDSPEARAHARSRHLTEELAAELTEENEEGTQP